MKKAVAANMTTASEDLPFWPHVFHFDGVGWAFKPSPVGGYDYFAADLEIDNSSPLALVEL